jgi:hypothetical protein
MPIKRADSSGFDFDVAGMGLNAVDHICVVPRFPKYEEKLRMVDFKKSPGGQVASASVEIDAAQRGIEWRQSLREKRSNHS